MLNSKVPLEFKSSVTCTKKLDMKYQGFKKDRPILLITDFDNGILLEIQELEFGCLGEEKLTKLDFLYTVEASSLMIRERVSVKFNQMYSDDFEAIPIVIQ